MNWYKVEIGEIVVRRELITVCIFIETTIFYISLPSGLITNYHGKRAVGWSVP